MNATQRIREIDRRLGARALIFFGTRGADAETLFQIPQFEAVFSQIAPLQALSIHEMCLEALTGERVDLDQYNIDTDDRDEVRQLRRGLLRQFERPAAVLPYRPSAVLASAWFPRSRTTQYLGVFHEQQASFEHKPWVERELAKCGVRVIPWRYFADDEVNLIRERAATGPLVLRANKTDGGAGVRLVLSPDDVEDLWPRHGDGFLAAAPFLEGGIPLNVNACAFRDGRVSLHGVSLQLIGITGSTRRRFGFCGSDFARAVDLDPQAINQLETMASVAGGWLSKHGYVGAFGIDALLCDDGRAYLTEVNPRFQGSSLVSAYVDRELERPDLYMSHIAAFLDLDPPPPSPLRELVVRQPPYAHIICHNTTSRALHTLSDSPDALPIRCRLIPRNNVAVKPEAIAFQAVFDGPVTDDGMSLLPEPEAHIRRLWATLYGSPAETTQQARDQSPTAQDLQNDHPAPA